MTFTKHYIYDIILASGGDFLENAYLRSELLLGKGSTEILKNKRVAVFGAGGVGSYAIEALARSGIGNITVIDGDKFSSSNLNRQLFCTTLTLGEYKADAAVNRIKIINPTCNANAVNNFYTAESDFDFTGYDYIVDAIDNVSAKISLITAAKLKNIPIISSMGAGNKLDPTAFRVADIYETSVCPLARIMRSKLKEAGVERLKVVYSKETPIMTGNDTIGSVPFVPSVAGLILAGAVIKDLLKTIGENNQ